MKNNAVKCSYEDYDFYTIPISLKTVLHSDTKQQQENPTKLEMYTHLMLSCSSFRPRHFLEHPGSF